MVEETTFKAKQIDLKLPVSALLAWFEHNRRPLPWRKTTDPYAIWVSEVMLQQTQVDTVIPYFNRFMHKFPSLKSLAQAKLDDVLLLWQGLGYYQRARNLHRAAQLISEELHGHFPSQKEEFLALPGVGDYIAAAVLSIAFNRHQAVLDGNVIRVCARYWGISTLINSQKLKKNLVLRIEQDMPFEQCGDFNQALMELGATVCMPFSWQCGLCPLKSGCFAKAQACQASLPARKVRQKRPRYQVALAVIMDGQRVLIQKRKEGGHLGGLWEFVGGKVEIGESAIEAIKREGREEIGCELACRFALPNFLHVYTHFEVEIFPYICCIESGQPIALLGQPLLWILLSQRQEFAFPAANVRIFKDLCALSEVKAQLETDV